jgi:hypothetical protein
MNSRAHFRLTIETLAAAALCLAWHAAATAQSYSIRPNCNSSPGASGCYIRPGTYGYNDTWWREWPTQHRPEISDPRAIGAGRLPTPPAVPEVKLPPGGNLPSRPPMGSEGSALPNLGLSGSGSTAPLRQPRPGEGTLIAPGADGTLLRPSRTSCPAAKAAPEQPRRLQMYRCCRTWANRDREASRRSRVRKSRRRILNCRNPAQSRRKASL